MSDWRISSARTLVPDTSRAGKMTIDMFARVQQFEHNFAQALSSPFVDRRFPFFDLYPWMGHLGTEGAVDLVWEYFGVTRLRIMVTLYPAGLLQNSFMDMDYERYFPALLY